jgi:OOP family OmpA-OmpF porin
MKFTTKIIATILAIMPVMVLATDIQPFWETADGKNQYKTGFGDCWQTLDYVPTAGYDSCGEPIVAEVEPEPEPVQVAAVEPEVKPVTHMISFSDEALFAFDKSVLKPEGKIMLDGLVNQLNVSASTMTTTYDDINITGHTDRIGSNQYNQDLSERRAQTVKDYLTNSNVRTNRITAVGRGEMEPTTNTADCKGTFANVVACLQPDRRVEVTMTGTQTITSN